MREGESKFDEEVMDLTYPFRVGTRADIPPKTHRFINLCCTTKGLNGAHKFSFAVGDPPARVQAMYENSVAGFEVQLVIAADNVAGRRIDRVPIHYAGTFESLDFPP
jgi:hypothetical protein